MERRLGHGNLSERILAAFGTAGPADAGVVVDEARIRQVYAELADHLDANEPWWG